MTTSAELELPTVTVSPGGEATTTLTVRNDSDIVEAYTLTVVGECAAWSTVEPARVSLYPGTSETVTVRLAPPRSHEVRAGDKPLGVRVLPVEHPENVVVPETTVHVEAFHEVRQVLDPRRRRGWMGARYRIALKNQSNIPVSLALAGRQAGEELSLTVTPQRQRLEPGETAELGLKARVRSLIWFGEPVSWPFEIEVADAVEEGAGGGADADSDSPKSDRPPAAAVPQVRSAGPGVVDGEFVQLPILPKWLLILLAILIALLVAWFALVRPAVKSAAKEAATTAQKEEAAKQEKAKAEEQAKAKPTPKPGGQEEGSGDGGSGTGPGRTGTGGGQQSSATIDIKTGAGGKKVGTYQVPEGKVFGITDMVVANFQGDEGIITISFGERKITTIALETFRNQDYHWVTPIDIPENSTVTAEVTCSKPGTPATGKQASGCNEVLNVSGVLRDLRP
ncbi:hydrolytic protein [Streptomyces sp. P9(2023)]|uniref:COG1470 family protein n=1 Tax=Streptomyces sp. P9(2023) TaxID=3064394 RepID=UPI0028F432FE|nr:hydrolytic protein [Streptomyces sp. P9(2023)]MDT9689870.1 hydrolytic protein [Streptomyces sp. P9(2023)]